MMLPALIVCLVLTQVTEAQVTPPVWPVRFTQDFVESYSQSKIVTAGKIWYDSELNASLLLRRDGRNEQICNSVFNASGTCVQLVRNEKRYVIFPDKQTCCFCCDAAHGCGILRRDWLKTAQFEGVDTIMGEKFNKFSIPDGIDMDYYWATINNQTIPRKMNEGDLLFKDFLMNTYSQAQIDPSIFALPSYCKGQTCPVSSLCGKFRSRHTSDRKG